MDGIVVITYRGQQISTNIESLPAFMFYNGDSIGFINGGETKTFKCANKYMLGNLGVGNRTLLCSEKTMDSDVVVTAQFMDSVVLDTFEIPIDATNVVVKKDL